jgi:hypothetical protein
MMEKKLFRGPKMQRIIVQEQDWNLIYCESLHEKTKREKNKKETSLKISNFH